MDRYLSTINSAYMPKVVDTIVISRGDNLPSLPIRVPKPLFSNTELLFSINSKRFVPLLFVCSRIQTVLWLSKSPVCILIKHINVCLIQPVHKLFKIIINSLIYNRIMNIYSTTTSTSTRWIVIITRRICLTQLKALVNCKSLD